MKAKLANFIALDLGSSKLAIIAAYIDKKGEVSILAQKLYYSEGFKSGAITDFKAAENSVISAIYAIEKECGKNIKGVNISISGAGTASYYIQHKIKTNGNQINKQDVKKLLEKMLSECKSKDHEILHYFPIEYVIDDNSSVDNPIGIIGKELSCHLHIVTAVAASINNISNCFDKAQIELENVDLGVYTSGIACLSEDEKNIGTIIIDMGAKTTCLGIFLSGKLIYSGFVPFGGDHITSDIAKVFSVSLPTAEKLKVLYGSVTDLYFEKNININIDELEPENLYNNNVIISSNKINEVMHARAEEILKELKTEFERTSLDSLIARQIVLTGGCAIMRGIKELTSKIFEKQVRIGKPSVLNGFVEDYNPGTYSTVIGVVKNHVQKKQKKSFDISAATEDTSWLRKAGLWLKENI